jgi:hypothetical protein
MSVATATFPKAIGSREEFIAFIKTYHSASTAIHNPMSARIMLDTKGAKSVPAMLKLVIEAGRPDLVDGLIDHVDINFVDIDDRTALLTAIDMRDFVSFKKILARNPDLHYGDKDMYRGAAMVRICTDGLTAFLYALNLHIFKTAKSGDEQRKELSWPKMTIIRHTPLIMAVLNHHYNIVEMLCALDVDINAPCRVLQNTPLHFATRFGDLPMVKLLLSYGADPLKKDKNGRSPRLDLIKEGKYPEIVAYLQDVETGKILKPSVEPNTSNNSLRYMFSQRGVTCGSDIGTTILYEADPIRTDFQSSLTTNVWSIPAYKPDLSNLPPALYAEQMKFLRKQKGSYSDLLLYATPRYKKMKELEKVATNTRKRSTSLNAGEGDKMLKCFKPISSDYRGLTIYDSLDFYRAVLIGNSLGILTKNYNIGLMHVEQDTQKDCPPFDTVFAIELRFNEGVGEVGHAVGLLKQDGLWYFGDNEAGALHKFKDQAFVSAFYADMADSKNRTNIAYMIRNDRVTSTPSMIGYLFKTDTHYPPDFPAINADSLGGFKSFSNAIILYQTTPVATAGSATAAAAAAFGGSGTTAGGTRRRTRRCTRRRA